MESNFVDHIKIHCRSGKGGAGSSHLRREKYVPKGGPDGGDGGRGGHVILRGDRNFWTLLHLRYTRHIAAGAGDAGGRQQRSGASGKDVYIDVPLGTQARDADSGHLRAEITQHGESVVLLKGGKGGLGNTHFKSATRQTPRYAQPGLPGQEGWFTLELKVLADVGLVGFPNAGKSTLLSVLTAAKPAIADYPFTTLVPNLGIVSYRDHRSFVMADIPGIIEGAHRGRGIGHRFLRHIERNAILLFLIPADTGDPRGEYDTLLHELKMYKPELLDKKRLIALSKCDLLDAQTEQAALDLLANAHPDTPCLAISSHTRHGLAVLKDMLWNLMNPADD